MRFILFCIFLLVFAYGGLWFFSGRTYPIEYGISFNQNHAAYLGLDWQTVYLAMLDELKPKYARVAAMWSEVEREPDAFDFAAVDFMMDEAAKRGTKIMLVVGQKAPRWPECYVPDWVQRLSGEEAEARLRKYFTEAVERYRLHPALELWQVENEPYIKFRFGECARYNPEMVSNEIASVRTLDPNHKIIITDSGELSAWRRAIHAGDLFGTTVYRAVRTPGNFVFTYDWLPSAYYRLRARLNRKPYNQIYISELQAEPWFTNASPADTPLSAQEQTMNPERLQKNFIYASRTGFPRAYLWGVEWWYFMREKHADARYWEMVKEEIERR